MADVADPGANWVDNPRGKDVSVIAVNLNTLRDKKFEFSFFQSDNFVERIDQMRANGVSAGDGIFVLGFPMDMAGAQRNYVIVREGAIARVGEMLDRASDTFLIDLFVFPGNSGGPVVLRPDLFAVNGTKPQVNSLLIGIVVESVEYDDTANSQQTGRARITFEENSGLAVVLPVDYVEETVLSVENKQK